MPAKSKAILDKRADFKQKFQRMVKEPSYFSKLMLGHEVFDYNVPYMNDPNRFLLYRAGRKSGKSTTTGGKVVYHSWLAPFVHKEMMQHRKTFDTLIVAPTQNQAKVIMDITCDLVNNSPIVSKYVTKQNQDELNLRFIDGSGTARIYTRAAGDKGISLRGYMPNIAIIDECAFVKHAVLSALIPSVMAQKGHVWLTSTPFGKRGYFYLKHLEAQKANSKWHEYHVSSLSNPLISSDPELVEEVRDVTQEEYKQEVLGEFSDMGDNLISPELISDAVGPVTIGNKILTYYMGVDVAGKGKDETVFTLIAVDRYERVYVIRTFAELKSNATSLVDKMDDWCREFPIEEVFIDSTGHGGFVVDLALERGLPAIGVPFTNKSKYEMYKTVVILFENHRIRIPNTNNKLFTQLAYMKQERKETMVKIGVDQGLHDDHPDSLALACKGVAKIESWSVGGKMSTPSRRTISGQVPVVSRPAWGARRSQFAGFGGRRTGF